MHSKSRDLCMIRWLGTTQIWLRKVPWPQMSYCGCSQFDKSYLKHNKNIFMHFPAHRAHHTWAYSCIHTCCYQPQNANQGDNQKPYMHKISEKKGPNALKISAKEPQTS